VLIVLAAMFGPHIVLTTAGERHRPSAEAAERASLVRHRPARARRVQPRHCRDETRLLHRRRVGRAGLPEWAALPASPPDSSAAGPTAFVGRVADTIMAFPLFVLAMGIVAALGNTVQNIIIAPRS